MTDPAPAAQTDPVLPGQPDPAPPGELNPNPAWHPDPAGHPDPALTVPPSLALTGHPDIVWHPGEVATQDRVGGRLSGGVTALFTGLSGAGKSTVAHAVEVALVEAGVACYCLDGDNVRHGLNGDLGFSPADRSENVRRVGEVARLLADAGMVVLVPVIAPYRADRDRMRAIHDAAGLDFREVHVDAPLAVVEERDTKGLYARARAGELTGMTGIDAPYEAPDHADLVLDTATVALDDLVATVVANLTADAAAS